MKYILHWRSVEGCGKDIDEADTFEQAQRLRKKYELMYKGSVSIFRK